MVAGAPNEQDRPRSRSCEGDVRHVAASSEVFNNKPRPYAPAADCSESLSEEDSCCRCPTKIVHESELRLSFRKNELL